MYTHAIYQPGQLSLQAVATNGLVDQFDKKPEPVEDYLAVKNFERHSSDPEFICLPIDEAIALLKETQREVLETDWTEITRKEWFRALEVLPPIHWKTVEGIEFFALSEAICDSIHHIYARRGNRHFTRHHCIKEPFSTFAAEIKSLT